MDVLRNNEEMIMCPYNPAHYIRKCRMDVHLKKCRKSSKDSEKFVICDFNSTHRIPHLELQYHHGVCPFRKTVELHVFSEEHLKVPTELNLPAVPVPVDSSWDDEVVPSYDPKKYCLENNIIRRLDTESAAVRRDFRIAERHRLNNLPPSRAADQTQSTQNKMSSYKSRANNQNLPPTPMYSQRAEENTPVEITRMMMEKVSLMPKAVIPKQK